MDSLLERLLKHYSMSQEDYARYACEPSFSSIPPLDEEIAAKRAKQRILQAIKNKEKCIVYGDYDVDGVMSTSIILYSFIKLGGSIRTFIPSRYLDGYGLNMENAEKIAKAGYSLVILVDNGVSCLEPISYLLSKGIETIIIDHHELPLDLPPAYATIHPTLLQYGEVPVSAGFLSFAFSRFLLEEDNEYLMLLGALSTISDMMPVKAHNREIIRLALRYIRKNKVPQIRAFTQKKYIDEKILSMEVIPALNAVGRVCKEHKVDKVVHYFAESWDSNSEKCAAWMREVNESRKIMTKEASERIHVDEQEPAIVVVGTLPAGLNGLLANRLMTAYNKPTVVFTVDETDPTMYVGSVRSRNGFNVMECFRHLEKYIVKSGGHAFAGGVSIKRDDYPEFRKGFLFEALRQPMKKEEEELIPLSLSEANMDSYRIIRNFAPFGMEWKEPIFVIENLPTDSLVFSKDGKRLQTPLGYDVRLFSFSYGKQSLDARKERVSFKTRFEINEYMGKTSLQLTAEELE